MKHLYFSQGSRKSRAVHVIGHARTSAVGVFLCSSSNNHVSNYVREKSGIANLSTQVE